MIRSGRFLALLNLVGSIALGQIDAAQLKQTEAAAQLAAATSIADSLANLEALADGAETREFVGRKNGVELDTGKIDSAYGYFKMKDVKLMEKLKESTPRVYTLAKILLETYPQHLEANKPKPLTYASDLAYLSKLIDLYKRERSSLLTGNDNMADLLSATKMGAFIKSLACSANSGGPNWDLLDEARGELKRQQFVDLRSTGDELDLMDRIEDKAVYLGNLPVKLIQQRILPALLFKINSPTVREPKDLEGLDVKFKSWLQEMSYKIDCD